MLKLHIFMWLYRFIYNQSLNWYFDWVIHRYVFYGWPQFQLQFNESSLFLCAIRILTQFLLMFHPDKTLTNAVLSHYIECGFPEAYSTPSRISSFVWQKLKPFLQSSSPTVGVDGRDQLILGTYHYHRPWQTETDNSLSHLQKKCYCNRFPLFTRFKKRLQIEWMNLNMIKISMQINGFFPSRRVQWWC